MPINFNINPYYDDFDGDKGFLRILFRPGYAVQARELTQLQTIVQEQLKDFGTGVYQDGSIVYGGQSTYDSSVQYYRLQPTINGVTVTQSILDGIIGQNIIGRYDETFSDIVVQGRTVTSPSLTSRLVVGAQITVSTPSIESRKIVAISADGQSATLNLAFSDAVRTGTTTQNGQTVNVVSGVDLTVSYETRAYCLAADSALQDGTPPILYLSTLDGPGISQNNQIFLSDANTQVDPATVQIENAPNFSGAATAVHLDEGVFFINKFFVHAPSQTVIIGKESDAVYPPTTRVGLNVSEVIIDDGDDGTLLDPAQGSYNYTAPGAHRFTIDLSIGTKTFYDETNANSNEIDDNADIDFIELLRVQDGELIKQVKYPLYSVIGDTMARRTAEIQGNFVIDPFLVEMGPLNATQCEAKLDPGKAYVRGYEFETVGPTSLPIDKARDFGVAQDTDIGTSFGNYVVTNNNIGRFDVATQSSIDLMHMYTGFAGYVLKIPTTEWNGDDIATLKTKVKPGQYVAVSDTAGGLEPARYWGIVESSGNFYVSLEAKWDSSGPIGQYTFPQLNGLTGATQNYNIWTLTDATKEYNSSTNVESVRLTDGSTAGVGSDYIETGSGNRELEIPTEAYNIFKIGTARVRMVRFFERDTDATHPLGVIVKNRLHIYDILVTGASFDDVHALTYSSTQGTVKRVIGAGIVDEEDGRATQLVDGAVGATRLIDSAFNSLLFSLPYEVIRSVRSDGLTPAEGGVGNINYRYTRDYTNVSVDAGSGETTLGTIQAPTSSTFYPSAQGVLSTLVAQQNYVVAINSGSFTPSSDPNITFQKGDVLDMSTGDVLIDIPSSNNGGDLRVRFDGTVSSGFTININTTLNFDNGLEKPKTLVQRYINYVDAPNTDILNLYTSDCYKVIGVWDSGDANNPIDPVDIGTYTVNDDGDLIDTDGVTVAYANIAQRYTFNTGQTDNLYKYGSLKLGTGATKPTGQVTVLFEYFQHSNVAGNISGMFTVNSYDDIDYVDVPTYTTTRGAKVDLRDSLDFRPRLRDATIPVTAGTAPTPDVYTVTANGANVTTFDEVQQALLSIPTGTVETDFSYFLSRIDRICITPDLELTVIKGKSALDPETPGDIDGAMTIYFLYVPAYTFSCSDIDPKFIENKRFTMKDLGNLEKRVSKVEFYTALSLLEKQAKDLSLFDENGNIILKTGILIDPFEGHSIGDVANPDYDCSIDFAKSILRPPFTSQQIRMEFDALNSTGVIKTGDVITLPYESRRLVNQPLTSKSINVNPYNVVNFLGSIDLNPPSDNWIDTETRPALNVNLQGENDAWRALIDVANEGIRRSPRIARQYGFGTQWNDWETTWTGTKKVSSETTTENRWYETSFQYFVPGKGRPIRGNDVTRETFEISSTEVRTGIKSEFVPETITKDLGNRILSVSIVPYIRPSGVLFKARGLKPNTNVYPYFDKQDVSQYVIPSQEVTVGAFVGDLFEDYETIEAYLVDGNNQQVGDTLASAVIVSGFFANPDQLRYVNVQKISSTFTGTGLEAFDPTQHPLVVNGTYLLKIRGTNATKFDAITGITSARTKPTVTVISASNKAFGDSLITDSRGRVDGVFSIPNNDTIKFRTGERQFRLSDVSGTAKLDNSQTNADAVYTASGVKQVQQGLTVSTRVPSISRTSVREERTTTDVVTRETRGPSRIVGWYDPLAETFLVDPVRYPDGIMLSACDLFFKTKDENLPVSVQIRPTSNGYPSSNTVVPFGQVDIDPENVVLPTNVTDNASIINAPTRATFPSPVFLEPGEYAIVVLTNSLNYETYISEMGQNILGSSQRITKQPYNGSLFKSQNSSTWSAYQYEDLMFRLYRCEFDTSATGYATFKSEATSETTGFNLFQSQVSVLNETSKTDVEFGYKATDSVTGQQDGTWIGHVENQNIYLPREKFVDTTAGRFQLQGAMRSTSSTISPLIDTNGMAMIAVGNYINNADLTNEDFLVVSPGSGFDPAAPPSTTNGNITISGGGGAGVVAQAVVESDGTISGINVLSGGAGYVETATISVTAGAGQTAPDIRMGGETNARGGNALARYITRRVTLASDTESDQIQVFLNAYRPRDTRIEVYYKVLNSSDQTDFDDRPYVRMEQDTTSASVFSVTEKDIRELRFIPAPNVLDADNMRTTAYADSNGTLYTTYNTFAIKICFFSTTTQKVPFASDLRIMTGKK